VLVPDEGAVEEFVADGADPAFAVGVRPGCPVGAEYAVRAGHAVCWYWLITSPHMPALAGRGWTYYLRASFELGSVDIVIDKLETASDARPSYEETYAHACVWLRLR